MSNLEPFDSAENSLQKDLMFVIKLASMFLKDMFPFAASLQISLATVAFRPAIVTCDEGRDFAIYWAIPSPIPAVPPTTRARKGVGKELRVIKSAIVII